MAQSPLLRDAFGVTRDDEPGDDYINRLLSALDLRFSALNDAVANQKDAYAAVVAKGLSNINDYLGPAAAKLFSVLSNGFLLAHSTSQNTLAAGATLTFIVPPGDERDLFVPSPFVTISRISTMDDYAFARTLGYDVTQGNYTCVILAYHGDPGPHVDWMIQDGTGASAAMMDALSAVLSNAAQVATQAAAVAAVNARFTVSALAPTGGKDGDIWFKV